MSIYIYNAIVLERIFNDKAFFFLNDKAFFFLDIVPNNIYNNAFRQFENVKERQGHTMYMYQSVTLVTEKSNVNSSIYNFFKAQISKCILSQFKMAYFQDMNSNTSYLQRCVINTYFTN